MKSGRPLRTRLGTARKARKAAELVEGGMHLIDVATELGYASASGVAMLLERYRAELPREASEKLQAALLARLETVERMALQDALDTDAMVRDRAQRRIIRAVEARGRISGIVKLAPAVVMVNQFATVGPDLSRLSIDEVETLQRIQSKLLEAPIVAQGEAVEDDERKDGRDDGGAGLDDRP